MKSIINDVYNVKNCKNNKNKCENDVNFNLKVNLNAENVKSIETKQDMQEQKMKAYVKTLLTIYPTLPNIVSIVDGIVEKRASTSISLSSIYAGSMHTYKQIEKVIDLSERKYKLLNIFSLIKELITPLSLRDYEIVDLKYFRRKTIADISERLEMDERSIYRRINKILDSIVKYMSIHFIDEICIENLIRGEGWIREIYNKAFSELSTNKIRSLKNKKKKEV